MSTTGWSTGPTGEDVTTRRSTAPAPSYRTEQLVRRVSRIQTVFWSSIAALPLSFVVYAVVGVEGGGPGLWTFLAGIVGVLASGIAWAVTDGMLWTARAADAQYELSRQTPVTAPSPAEQDDQEMSPGMALGVIGVVLFLIWAVAWGPCSVSVESYEECYRRVWDATDSTFAAEDKCRGKSPKY